VAAARSNHGTTPARTAPDHFRELDGLRARIIDRVQEFRLVRRDIIGKVGRPFGRKSTE